MKCRHKRGDGTCDVGSRGVEEAGVIGRRAFMPVTTPRSVVPAGKYREKRAAATNHDAMLFSALTKK